MNRNDHYAVRYFEEAVKLNHPGAMYYLSQMYRLGEGVKEDQEVPLIQYCPTYSLSQANVGVLEQSC